MCKKLAALALVFLFAIPPNSAAQLFVRQNQKNHGPSIETRAGIVVETISHQSEGEKAKLQSGDELLSWSRGSSKGEIQSPFDLIEIEMEQAPRGTVILAGLRGSEKRTWALGPGSWQVQARPNFSERLLSVYLEGAQLAKAGQTDQAVSRWRALIEAMGEQAEPSMHSWLLFHIAETLHHAQQWNPAADAYQAAAAAAVGRAKSQVFHASGEMSYDRADWANSAKYYQQALKESQDAAPESFSVAIALTMLGIAVENLGDFTSAEKYCQQALTVGQKLVPESLSVARSLECLGNIANDHQDLVTAEERYRQSLAIREKLVPNSSLVADSFHNLGGLVQQTDTRRAREYQQRALDLYKQLGADSVRIASTLINIGNANRALGDLEEAESCYRQALILFEKTSPTRRGVAVSLFNLGRVAELRGDLAKAEEYFQRTLAIEKLPADRAFTLTELGGLARERWDLDKAEQYYRQGLAIREKSLPGTFDHAGSLGNLGLLALDRGDDVKAEAYLRQSLAIIEKVAPSSLGMAWLYAHLGFVAKDHRNLAEAEADYRKGLEIARKAAPEGPVTVEILSGLGDVLLEKGELGNAEEYYGQALAMLAKSFPAGWRRATILAGLASIARERKDLEQAAKLFQQAVDALEEQTVRLGGAEEVRAYFRSRQARYYKDYIDLLVRQGHSERAFEISERSHARSLLETLALAHLDVRKGADPGLLERERTLSAEIRVKSERRSELLSDSKSQQLAIVEKEVAELVRLRQDVEARIRDNSPAFAALMQPQPLSAREVQERLLDRDTALLEYSLGEKRSYAFLLTRSSVRAYVLPGRSLIERAARRVYQLLIEPNRQIRGESLAARQKRLATAEAQYSSAAAALSRMVLRPVAAQFRAKRLLVVADGALQYIPFGVLPLGQQKPVPLIADRETTNLPSASVLAILRHASGRKPVSKSVAVLADPVFSKQDARVHRNHAGNSGDPTSPSADSPFSADLDHSTRDVGLSSLRRLAFSRQEAKAIASAVPVGSGLVALDFKASRSTATNPELGQYRIVHFATHGLLNSEHPELSGLVLSLVNEDGNSQNGFMTLDDIYNLDWPADLVVLSSCQTGLGKEIQGEGLSGLTQGFMYAGARAVVASLWSVDDAATAAFMTDFYKFMLRNNLPPAAALRKTQMRMQRNKRWANPYYWGAFIIQGEWATETAPAKPAVGSAH